MSDPAVQASDPPSGAESHHQSTQPEAPLPEATYTSPQSPTHPPDRTGPTGPPLAHQDESIDTSYNGWPATRPEASLQGVIDTTQEQKSPLQGLDPPKAGVSTMSATQEPGANDTKPMVLDKPTIKSETILQDILDTMYESDMFERTRKDAPSRFWSIYARVAKQYDDELIERHSGDLDVLLIFAGLFSAISSAFIVNMQSSLSPVPSDTTNSLLMILINAINGSTFPAQQAYLPIWTGPNSTTIWIQTLAYTSLSSSLLAAFGAVLGKQWLGHFKTSRFGQGALHERGQQRQKKLDALAVWHFNTIIATLPILLQMSLLFFGISLSANIWTLQHTIASVIMATTGFGFLFYFFTVVSSLKSPDCPFQTPVSTILRNIYKRMAPVRKGVRSTIEKVLPSNIQYVLQSRWEERPRTWADFVNFLHEASRYILCAAEDLIVNSLTPFVTYLSSRPSTRCQVPLLDDDPETRIPLELVDVSATAFKFNFMQSYATVDGLVPSCAVQWVIETSTDTDVIAAAAGMVSEIEWPAKVQEPDMLEEPNMLVERLQSGFYACFDPNREILPIAQADAVACLKAMWRLCVERDLPIPFHIYTDGNVRFLSDHDNYWHMVQGDSGFLVVCSAVDEPPNRLDTTRLPLSDRMWMAHMFTYRVHKGEYRWRFDPFVIKFIGICLDSKSPTGLVADCMLLAGMLVGLRIDRRDLARLDKSLAIETLQQEALNLTLTVLLDEIRDRGWHQNALKLIHPLLAYYDTKRIDFSDLHVFKRAFKFCCSLIDNHLGTLGDDQVRSKNVASLIRILVRTPLRDTSGVCTQGQFDLLVDYHLRVCQGTDDEAIRDTFRLLEQLRGSPSTTDRKHRYVDTLIRFMGKRMTCTAALPAACAIRSTVASMGQDDESLREQFSQALTLALFLVSPYAHTDHNPFTNISFFDSFRQITYLRLLCALSQEPTWHPRLQQNGHFDNCFAIAKTLSSQGDDEYPQYVIPVAHIIAVIDAAGEEHQLSTAVQANSIWSLILRAWRYMFDLDGFGGRCGTESWDISTEECRAALPSFVEYARRRWGECEATIELVEKVCGKLDEEDPQCESDRNQRIQDVPFWKQVLPALCQQISELLDASQRNV